MRSRSTLALALGLGLGGLGCGDFHRGPAPRDAGADTKSGAKPLVADYVFETEVYPVLLRRCEDCHTAGKMAEFTKLVLTGNARSDRVAVFDLVVPGDPAASLLLRRASGESHTGKTVLAQGGEDYETVANWILGLTAE